MNWNEGNIWKARIDLGSNHEFEFKFVFVEHDKVKRWENGSNRTFKLDFIKSILENENTNSDNEINIQNKFSEDYVYNSDSALLRIISKWKN